MADYTGGCNSAQVLYILCTFSETGPSNVSLAESALCLTHTYILYAVKHRDTYTLTQTHKASWRWRLRGDLHAGEETAPISLYLHLTNWHSDRSVCVYVCAEEKEGVIASGATGRIKKGRSGGDRSSESVSLGIWSGGWARIKTR